jgi:hypothetical protein
MRKITFLRKIAKFSWLQLSQAADLSGSLKIPLNMHLYKCVATRFLQMQFLAIMFETLLLIKKNKGSSINDDTQTWMIIARCFFGSNKFTVVTKYLIPPLRP